MRHVRWLERLALASLAAAATLVVAPQISSSARAQPLTVWQQVKHPDLGPRLKLRDMADRKREPRDETYDADAIRTQLSRAAATLLGLARADTLNDVELTYLYGECLAFAGDEFAERARVVLRRALELDPNHPSASGAWDSLGRVNMALGDYAAGYAAFERSLETEWRREVRDVVLIEQGLGALRARDLERAVERLAAANSDTSNPVAWALSQWALAVAMDRALLGPEAERLAFVAAQARFGASGKQDVLSLPEVDVGSDFEVSYYRALAAMGRARVASSREQRGAYLEAKFLWLRYIGQVGPAGPWSSRVQQHLAAIDRIEERLAPREAEADELHREALRPARFETPELDAGVEPIWPEEVENASAFWGLDAGPDSDG